MNNSVERTQKSLFDVLHRNRTVAAGTAIVGAILVCALVLLVHPKYGAISHVLLINDASGRDPVAAGLDMPTIATSTSVVSDVRSKLGLTDTISDLQKGIAAHVAPRSSIMTIAYRGHTPGSAISVANAVADSFVSFYSHLPQERSKGVIDSLGRDLVAKKAMVVDLERRVESAAVDSAYVGSQASLDNRAHDLSELHEQRGIVNGLLVGDEASLAANTLQPGKMARIYRHEMLSSDPGYHELSLAVARDRSAYETFNAGVKDEYPGLAGLRDKMQRERDALSSQRNIALGSPDAYSPSLGGQVLAEDKAKAAVAGDRARLVALDEQIQKATQQMRTDSSGSQSLGGLRAQRDAAEAQFQALALRYSNAQGNAAESDSLGRAVVIDRAVKAEPSLIGTNLLLLIGLLLVSAISVGAAYVAESFWPRFLAPTDVEAIYGQPTLASL